MVRTAVAMDESGRVASRDGLAYFRVVDFGSHQ